MTEEFNYGGGSKTAFSHKNIISGEIAFFYSFIMP